MLAPSCVGISELKANPTAVLEASGDQSVAILNRNKPVGYMVTAAAWEKVNELLEDKEILKIVESRLKDRKKPIRVKLDDL
ncbi:type II toxin-antitoxin system prevent-host-death family antitoxin [Undibacterium sp. Tian12W]|uniref:type II toxin-antitoxin system prevent-host-death family antitoxin n=1 Tax=Undibacterium sp. Tian12W TaxID=3413054 RepID=UPI003BF01DCC